MVVTSPTMRSNLCIAGRYLPFIHHDVNLLAKHYSFSSRYKVTTNKDDNVEFNKDSCCEHCIKGVNFWLDVSRRQGDQLMRNCMTFVNETTDKSFQGKTEMYKACAEMFGGSSINKYDYRDVIDKAFKIWIDFN